MLNRGYSISTDTRNKQCTLLSSCLFVYLMKRRSLRFEIMYNLGLLFDSRPPPPTYPSSVKRSTRFGRGKPSDRYGRTEVVSWTRQFTPSSRHDSNRSGKGSCVLDLNSVKPNPYHHYSSSPGQYLVFIFYYFILISVFLDVEFTPIPVGDPSRLRKLQNPYLCCPFI